MWKVSESGDDSIFADRLSRYDAINSLSSINRLRSAIQRGGRGCRQGKIQSKSRLGYIRKSTDGQTECDSLPNGIVQRPAREC